MLKEDLLHPNARVSFKNKKEDEKLFITH